MSYPDPVYPGAGEVSASFRPDATAPDLGTAPGPTVEYLAPSDLTGGQFGLYRWSFGGQVSGPDAHFHRTISESFYVLSGTVRLYDGDRWIDARPGDFLHVPAGGIHAFKNESGAPASMLLHFRAGRCPGGVLRDPLRRHRARHEHRGTGRVLPPPRQRVAVSPTRPHPGAGGLPVRTAPV